MEQLVKIWCKNHPSIIDYSIPGMDPCISEDTLSNWEIREEDKDDFENWFPIFTNCTGVHYTTYYYNLNNQSSDSGKILGLWCHCGSGEVNVEIVAQTLDEFLSNPKYQSRIKRMNDHTGPFKISILSDFEL